MRQLVVFLLFIFQPIRIMGQLPCYDNFMDHLNSLENRGDYAGALEYLHSNENAFPDQWFALSKEQKKQSSNISWIGSSYFLKRKNRCNEYA
jgi:hypothetical protein